MYKKFGYQDFNNSNFILYRSQRKYDQDLFADMPLNMNQLSNTIKNSFHKSKTLNSASIKNDIIMVNKHNMNIIPVKNSDRDDTSRDNEDLNTKMDQNTLESFLNESSNSSIKHSTLFTDSPLLSVYSLRMKKLKSKKRRLRFLNKNKFPKEYSPKILTTAECKIKLIRV